MSDYQSLVARAVAGDGHAFTQLLKSNDDKMRGVAWRLLGSVSDMDDALQDAYVKAWRSIADFRGDAAFSSWLYRIVHTTCIDHLRAQQRRTETATKLARQDPPIVPDPSTAVTEADELRAALAELPADQLCAVALVDGEGLSYDEVAALVDSNAGTVASRLHRARAALRRTLAETAGEN